MTTNPRDNDLPKLAAPARRALAGAGLANLAQLARQKEADVAALHGIGPDAMATLQVNGISLSLFHLIALMLGAGLGLDYALFFEHAADDPHEQRRTLHAVLVCSLSTLMVFALLALSSIPVLRAIGLTVSLAVVSNFLLAVMVTRGTSGEAHLRPQT